MVAKQPDSLLDQIEAGALGTAPLADLLRKCLMLGGRSGSAAMMDWAGRELNGYDSPEELPNYRNVSAPLQMDGSSGMNQFRGMSISVLQLPDFAQASISGQIPLMYSVGEIEALVRVAGNNGDLSVKLSPPMSAELVAYMNGVSQEPHQHIDRIYWSLHPAVLEGVLDRVRTNLVALMAELRLVYPMGDSMPSSEVADQAVSVVVGGSRNRVTVATAGTQGTTSIDERPTLDSSPWWRSARGVWAIAVGGATIVATGIAFVQWRG